MKTEKEIREYLKEQEDVWTNPQNKEQFYMAVSRWIGLLWVLDELPDMKKPRGWLFRVYSFFFSPERHNL